MALVNFKIGTALKYAALETKSDNTLYFITDTHEIYKGSVKYAAGVSLQEGTSLPAVATVDPYTIFRNTSTGEVSIKGTDSAWHQLVRPVSGTVEKDSTSLITSGAVAAELDTINDELAGSISDISELKQKVEDNANDIEALYTNVVSAASAASAAQKTADAKVASVAAGNKGVTIGGTTTAPTVGANVSTTAGNMLKIDANGLFVPTPAAAAEYSIIKDSTAGDYAAVYHLTRAGVNTGVAINIPKDMVVSSGEVVKNPTGKDAGTYLVLTLANATNDKVYIPVDSLIEYVTSGSTTGDKVVIAVDSTTHKVTASITPGTIALADLTTTVQNTINAAVPNTRKVAGKALSADISAADLRTALNVANGAEVNQNAFSKVKVGTTEISAAAKTDTVEVAAGSNITVTPDATNKKVTIAATGLEAAGTAAGLIANLDVTDTAVSDKYVSAVSETDGKISVTRADLPTASSLGAITSLTGGSHISIIGTGTSRTIAATDVATAAQGTNADNAISALTWGTL